MERILLSEDAVDDILADYEKLNEQVEAIAHAVLGVRGYSRPVTGLGRGWTKQSSSFDAFEVFGDRISACFSDHRDGDTASVSFPKRYLNMTTEAIEAEEREIFEAARAAARSEAFDRMELAARAQI